MLHFPPIRPSRSWMPGLRMGLCAILAFALLAAVGSNATAEEPDLYGRAKKGAALKELETGNKLYKQREFARAIDFYKSGQLIEDAPIFLYNIGQCYRQLGDYEKAIWFYERWLSAFKPAVNNPARQAVEKWIPQMQAELEQRARTEPPLEAAPEEADEPEADEHDQPDLDITAAPASSTKDPWYAYGLGWGLVGGGVAALAVGGGMFGSAAGKDSDANDEPTEMRRNQLRDEADTRRVVGYVFGGVGAALIVGGVVSFAIPSTSGESNERRAWIRVRPNRLAIGGRF